MHYLDSWIKIDQLDVTSFIISLFTAQHVSNVSTSILRSLRLTVDLLNGLYCSGSMCVGDTLWFGWGGVVLYLDTGWSLHPDTTQVSVSIWSLVQRSATEYGAFEIDRRASIMRGLPSLGAVAPWGKKFYYLCRPKNLPQSNDLFNLRPLAG